MTNVIKQPQKLSHWSQENKNGVVLVVFGTKPLSGKICICMLRTPHVQGIEPLLKKKKKQHPRGFPGGAVVKNPPANAGDMGSSPGPGRSHMPWSN